MSGGGDIVSGFAGPLGGAFGKLGGIKNFASMATLGLPELLAGPKPPPAPVAPPPPPNYNDQAAQAASAKELADQQRRGRRQNMITGPAGLISAANVQKKVLLGS